MTMKNLKHDIYFFAGVILLISLMIIIYISISEDKDTIQNIETNMFKNEASENVFDNSHIFESLKMKLYRLEEDQEDIYILPNGEIGYMKNGEIVSYESKAEEK